MIFEAIENFGSDGYLVFFGVMEILADELNYHEPGKLSISLKKMQKNFQLSRQKIVKILAFFDQKAKKNSNKEYSFFAEIGKTHAEIYCPKFRTLCDEYTQYKLRGKSGEDREKLGSYDRNFSVKNKTQTQNKNKNKDVNPAAAGQSFLDKIILKCETIREFSEKYKKKINIYAWVQKSLNQNGHPDAIDESLDALINKWREGDFVTSPWPYLEATFQLKNGNYWEDHHVQESQKFKNVWIEDETIQEMVGKIGKEI